MNTRKILSLTLLILVAGGIIPLLFVHHSFAAPVFAVDLDANSVSQTDISTQASATQTKTFRVGAVINATSVNQLSNIWAWTYVINYNVSLVVPQADPAPTPIYPDAADSAIKFGSQSTPGTFDWETPRSNFQAFGGFRLEPTQPGRLYVFYTLLLPQSPVTLFARTLLANVAFELVNKTAPLTPQSLTVSDVEFVDTNGAPLPDTIIAGRGASETITNDPPHATFTSTQVSSYVYAFDSQGSSDSDGSIPSPGGYFWDFGDGTQDLATTGPLITHDYQATCMPICPDGRHSVPGQFNVTLRVSDNLGATGSARDSFTTVIINVQPSHTYRSVSANQNPTASFTFTPPGPTTADTVTFDATASNDDGTIVSYSWDFGDGNSASGSQVTHAFISASTYHVTLIVTDNLGGQGSQSKDVIVTGPQNQPPTLSLTAPSSAETAKNVTISVTASDPDGTIASVKVNWGDGTIINQTALTMLTHTYRAAGTYTITVTVADNAGLTAQKTSQITVSQAPGTSGFLPEGLTLVLYILVAAAAVAAVVFVALRRMRASTRATPTP